MMFVCLCLSGAGVHCDHMEERMAMAECKLGVISQERFKTEVKLLLIANRKSYTACRLAQQWITLSDLEWPFPYSALSLW